VREQGRSGAGGPARGDRRRATRELGATHRAAVAVCGVRNCVLCGVRNCVLCGAVVVSAAPARPRIRRPCARGVPSTSAARAQSASLRSQRLRESAACAGTSMPPVAKPAI
jgi:hypothetical protein